MSELQIKILYMECGCASFHFIVIEVFLKKIYFNKMSQNLICFICLFINFVPDEMNRLTQETPQGDR